MTDGAPDRDMLKGGSRCMSFGPLSTNGDSVRRAVRLEVTLPRARDGEGCNKGLLSAYALVLKPALYNNVLFPGHENQIVRNNP